jgi:HSP20 family protein
MNGLISYKPSRGLGLLNDFDRVFGNFFNDMPALTNHQPLVDVREEKDRYMLEAELPGLTEKDVEVKIEENLLTISSARDEEKKEERPAYLMRERCYASFQRSFVLPNDVDREKVEASFKNGLLTLNLHKKPEAQPKNIEIKVEK